MKRDVPQDEVLHLFDELAEAVERFAGSLGSQEAQFATKKAAAVRKRIAALLSRREG